GSSWRLGEQVGEESGHINLFFQAKSMATQVRLVSPFIPGPYLPPGMLLSNCMRCRIPLENVHVQSCPRRFRHERALSFPCRPEPDRRQMDGADHSRPCHGDAALCRATARDRRHFAEDADPDIA